MIIYLILFHFASETLNEQKSTENLLVKRTKVLQLFSKEFYILIPKYINVKYIIFLNRNK